LAASAAWRQHADISKLPGGTLAAAYNLQNMHTISATKSKF
jgi:hypothetical protein